MDGYYILTGVRPMNINSEGVLLQATYRLLIFTEHIPPRYTLSEY